MKRGLDSSDCLAWRRWDSGGINVFKHLKGECRWQNHVKFIVPRARIMETKESHTHRSLPLNSKWYFFAVQMMKNWHRLPRGCGVSSLEVSRSHLDVGMGTLLWVTLLQWGWDKGTQEFLPTSEILWYFQEIVKIYVLIVFTYNVSMHNYIERLNILLFQHV